MSPINGTIQLDSMEREIGSQTLVASIKFVDRRTRTDKVTNCIYKIAKFQFG